MSSVEDTVRSQLMSTRKGKAVLRPDWMANVSRHRQEPILTSVPHRSKEAEMDDSRHGEHGQCPETRSDWTSSCHMPKT